ncbi:MAG: hypothetical protein MUQ10_03805 [Anaerolineae bacterium]|nr:hypothetical protein [Anaerolineae bacterium]
MIEPAESAGKQRAALESGDVEEALQLLSKLDDWIENTKAWGWLRSNEPESYEQLIAKLEQSSEGRSACGRTEMSQLAGIFESCRDHDISLVELDVSNNLHKYRKAAAKLNAIVSGRSEINLE